MNLLYKLNNDNDHKKGIGRKKNQMATSGNARKLTKKEVR
jgi:hypothetical protein